MNNYSIFESLSEVEAKELVSCFNFDERNYKKGDIIINFNETSKTVGIMQKGLSFLVSINCDGEKSIVDYYEPYNVFGKQFSPNINANLYYVIAKTECSVKFFDYNKMIICCRNNCQKHIKLINNLISTSIGKSQIHMEILSQRTIRNKLLAYFNYIKQQKGSDEISLPLSLSDLADYLSVDRSAMMRELKKMNNDNIISSKGHNITIVQNGNNTSEANNLRLNQK